MHYVIIGNGIVALATAFKLLKRLGSADTISIIGPRERTGSATLAAAAMLNSFAEVEAHSLRSEADRCHFELSRAATRAWPAFERELMEAAGAVSSTRLGLDTGTYVVNNAAASELDDRNFDAIVAALDEFDEPYDRVDPHVIPNYHPEQRSRASRAVLIRNEGWLNPRLMLQCLDDALGRARQIRMRDARATRLAKGRKSIEAVELDSGETLSGDVFLLANGASVGELLTHSGIDLGMQPVFYGVGVSLEIKSPDFRHQRCIRTPNRGGACGIYTVPLFTGEEPSDRLVIGASNFLSPTPFFHGRVVSVAHLLENACREINRHFYDAQLVRVNVGWRPTSQDTYPLLGRTSIDNLIVATGTKRDGFHLSPIISDLIADIMTGGRVDERLGLFEPERPVIRDLGRAEAIDLGVESLLSQHYQHGYEPSAIRMDAQLRQAFRADLEALHDKVGASDWGIPPELITMYRRGHAV